MEEIAPGIHQLDTRLGGIEKLTAGFLVTGPQPALVETGAQSSAATVVEALHAAGVGARDLRWLVVTHIHLDHAGGVGDLAAAFPTATVVVHPQGAPHLADPSRLIASASRVYGPLLDQLYGRMLAVPPERVLVAHDGLTLEVGGGRRLRIVDSPGHAKHHQALLEEASGTLMVGDAVGVRLPEAGPLRPATPPPDFDLELAVASLHRFGALRPERMVLTHYGPVEDPAATLAAAEAELRRWVELAERVLDERPDAGVEGVADAFSQVLAAPVEGASQAPAAGQDAEAQRRYEVLNGVRSNAAGIVRYLAQRTAAEPAR